ncbi:hypothetical protein SDC9_192829 [bioreactor metagenome]|uniref:Uncharacterized protein n=1 Tax=bioreactor metagenome TaxID=1076179 RepID=A0A645I3A8_9ZZZZ
MLGIVSEIGIDFIRDDNKIMFSGKFCNAQEFFFRHNGTGRIVRIAN